MTHQRHVRMIHQVRDIGYLHSDAHQPLSGDRWGEGEREGREVGEEFQRPEEELRQDRVVWKRERVECPPHRRPLQIKYRVKKDPTIKSLVRPGEDLGLKSRTMERHYVWGVRGVRRGIMASGKIKRSFY